MDHSAGKPVDARVLKAMLPYMKTSYGNPSSVHSFGQKAQQAIKKARMRVSQLVNAERAETIIFTSGATESNNMAIKGITQRYKDQGKHIITSEIEHMSVLNPCKFLTNQGFKATFLPVDKHGLVNLERLEEEVTSETILVSIMYANGEIGTIQPIKEISRIVHEKNCLLHSDATAATGQLGIDVGKEDIDILHLFQRHVRTTRHGSLIFEKGSANRTVNSWRRAGKRIKIRNRKHSQYSRIW